MFLKVFVFGFSLGVSAARAEITEDLPAEEKKPLYELGIGGGTGFFPHYPASDQGKWRSLVTPTFRYRGSIFRADEQDGARARLITNPWYGVELSGAGILPASSDENSTRAGMPDLDLLGELGPQLYFALQKDDTFETRISFPLRAAASTDFSSIRYRGYTFAPGIDFRALLPKSFGALKLKVSAVFASEDYQEYYYDVAAQYATETRPEYHSSGGYLGSRTELNYSGEWDRIAIFVQVGYQNYQNAKNSESPLFKTEHNFSGIVGIRWLLYHSDTTEGEKP